METINVSKYAKDIIMTIASELEIEMEEALDIIILQHENLVLKEILKIEGEKNGSSN